MHLLSALHAFLSNSSYLSLYCIITSSKIAGVLLVLWLLAHPSCQSKHSVPQGRDQNHVNNLVDKLETSQSQPFQVDFLEAYKIGMSIAPGRKKGKFFRDLEVDLGEIRDIHKIDVIVTLLRKQDMDDLRISSITLESLTNLTDVDMLERIHAAGMESLHFPVRDKWIPHSMNQFKLLVDEVVERIRGGKTVLVHCNGGKGRTGAFSCCWKQKT